MELADLGPSDEHKSQTSHERGIRLNDQVIMPSVSAINQVKAIHRITSVQAIAKINSLKSSRTLSYLWMELLAARSLLDGLNRSMISLVEFIEDMLINRLVEDVNLCSSELASADTLFEQNTQFGKGASVGLRETKVSVDDAEEADTALG